MLDFLKSFADTIVSLIEFVVSFVKNTIEICQKLFQSYDYAIAIFQYIPAPYKGILIILISYALIRAILHFGG